MYVSYDIQFEISQCHRFWFVWNCTTRRFALESLCVSVCLSVCPSSVSENAYNSWTAWNILIKSSIVIHANIIYRLPCITVFFDGRGFAEHQLKIWDQLVKTLITLEPRCIFTSNFVYLCTLTLSSHCHAKRWQGFAEYHFCRSSPFSENTHLLNPLVYSLQILYTYVL